jgi:hypothetical protein
VARKGQRLTAVQLENMRVGAAKRWSDPSYQAKQSTMRRRAWKKQSYQARQRKVNEKAIGRWRRQNPALFSKVQRELGSRKKPNHTKALLKLWADPVYAKRQLKLIGTHHYPEFLDRKGRHWVFKSTWELEFAQWLDRQKLMWYYEPCALLLSDGRRYFPDFWVPRWKTYVELKGAHFSVTKVQQAITDGHAVLLLHGRAVVKDFYGWVGASLERLHRELR